MADHAMKFRLQGLGRMLAVAGIVVGVLAGSVSGASAMDRTYVSDTYGYRVDWETREWDGSPAEPDGVQFFHGTYSSQGFIRGDEGDSENSAACVETMAADFEFSNPVQDMRVARDSIERPAFDREAGAAELYTWVAPTNEGGFDMAILFECLPLDVTGTVVKIILTTEYHEYDDVLASWESLLDGVLLPGEEPKNDDATPTAGDASSSYSNEDIGISIAWEGGAFEVTELNDDATGYGVELKSEGTNAVITALPYAITAADCLSLAQSQFSGTYAEVEVAGDTFERPESVSDAETAMLTYLDDDGETPMVVYLECREMNGGAAFLALYLSSPVDQYDNQLEVWNDILAGIEVG